MLRFSRLLFAAALALGPVAQAQAPADVAGEWDVTINSPQGTNQSVLTLKKDGDAWSGAMKGARGERVLQDIVVKGNELRFAMKVNFQGNDAIFSYVGTLEKGALKGSADFAGMATGDWSAVRKAAVSASGPATGAAPAPPAAPGAIDVSGNWVFAVETGAGSGQPTFTFKQDGEKLTGTYSGAFGKANLTGTLKGGEIKSRSAARPRARAPRSSTPARSSTRTACRGPCRSAASARAPGPASGSEGAELPLLGRRSEVRAPLLQ